MKIKLTYLILFTLLLTTTWVKAYDDDDDLNEFDDDADLVDDEPENPTKPPTPEVQEP